MRQDEAEARLQGLRDGPWTARAGLAWERIGSPPDRADREELKTRLKRLLAPHWKLTVGKEGGLVRDSFDEAITSFQLCELAIETGYLPLSFIKQKAAEDMTKLFWSKASKKYLWNYDYIMVGYLAQRVNFDLNWPRLKLPSIRPQSQGRFAAFLSQHRLWYDQGPLEDWLGFLDDYQIIHKDERADKDVLWAFLMEKDAPEYKKIWTLLVGADRHLILLSDLAQSLPKDELPHYGLFYSYWMARLFGYDRGDAGFFRDDEQTDWADAILAAAPKLRKLAEARERRMSGGVGMQLPASNPQEDLKLLRERIKVVQRFWEITRTFMNASLQKSS